LDKTDNKLYIADMLGNAIYRVDLKTLVLENIKLVEKLRVPYED
jgi:sugar lactone lactonase YvrE